MKSKTTQLNGKKIFLFWLPLASTWLMMSIEGPFLASIIARQPEPKANLAAYGVAYAIALFFEAPVIMMMTAATALIKNRATFLALRRFSRMLNTLVTITMLAGVIPPVFRLIAEDWIGLPPEVARLTHLALILLLPWPAAIGYRRFYQGVLIRAHLTRRVAYSTAIRLATMSLVALLLFSLANVPGALIGAGALTLAVISEAVAVRIMVRRIITGLEAEQPAAGANDSLLSLRDIIKFYAPLALTSMLGLGVNPIISFFLGQSRNAIESLAVLPVVNAFVFIFRSLGLAFQETGIALMGEDYEGFHALRRFALCLGTAIVGLLGLMAFTPAAQIWYHNISGLSLELTHFAILPTQILTIIPGLTLLLTFQRSVLITARKTRPVTVATSMEVIAIILILLLTTHVLDIIGVTAAAIAYVLGRLSANLYLTWPYKRILSQHKAKQSGRSIRRSETAAV